MERVGRYRVVRLLGSGGMGAVYEGFDEQLQRPVALKGLLAGDTSPEHRERLRREAMAVAASSHPGIAHVYEVVSEEERDWVVMELVEGTSLDALVVAGPLPPARVAGIGVAVALALAEAHRHGVIHRDVKTENVMLTPGGHVKVLDFGLALLRDNAMGNERLTAAGMVVGTSRAMSPEQAMGRPVDHRTDLFSLGSMLYELATGNAPFRGSTPMDTMVKVSRNEHVPLREAAPEVPEALAAVVERCLATDPDDRYDDAAAVARALEAALPASAAAWPPAAAAAARTRARRLPRMALPGAVALAVAAAAGVVALRPAWLFPPPPLTVAVLPVAVAGGGGAPPLAVGAVADAIASHLVRLERLNVASAQDVQRAVATGRSVAEVARELGVTELVEVRLTPHPAEARADISLSRIEAATSRVLWHEDLHTGTGDLMLLQDCINTALDDAYQGYAPPAGTPPRDVAPAALRDYLEAVQAMDAGHPSPGYRDEVVLFRRALAASPRYTDAMLQLAGIERSLYSSTEDPAHRDRCAELLDRAESISPGDPRIPLKRFDLLREIGDIGAAVTVARAAAAARPGDAGAWLRLGRGEAALGDVEASEKAFAHSIALRPAWQTYFWIADARFLRGDYAGARAALATLLERSPGNSFGIAKLAGVEVQAGQWKKAEPLYRWLVEHRNSTGDVSNLGLCLFYSGAFDEAADLFSQASARAPHEALYVVNLADARLWAGRAQEAMANYRRALGILESHASGGPAKVTARSLRLTARCLAHLGRLDEARSTIEDALRKAPDNPDTTFTAALVAAAGRDTTSCVAWTRKAMALGVPPEWFSGPEFASMRSDTRFAGLLREKR